MACHSPLFEDKLCRPVVKRNDSSNQISLGFCFCMVQEVCTCISIEIEAVILLLIILNGLKLFHFLICEIVYLH